MVCRKVMKFFFIVAITQMISASSTQIGIVHGQILLKRTTDTAWTAIETQITLENNDSLKMGDTPEAGFTIGKSISFLLRDLCQLTVHSGDNKKIVELNSGQILFQKDDSSGTVAIEVIVKGCIFTPIGTSAAIKITKEGNPSVAVLEGSVRMTNPDGWTQDVGKGMYSTFLIAKNTFSPVKPLPPNALAALESWAQTKSKPESPGEPQDDKKEIQAPETPAPQGVAESKSSDTLKVDTTVQKEQPQKETAEKEEVKQVEQPEKGAEDKPVETAEKGDKEPAKEDEKEKEKPEWELSAGMVTVDNEQWTRLALAVDVPIWRFGVCFDLELFMDAQGNFDNRGWNFGSGKEAGQSLLRKIRYIRLNHSGDPVYMKVGGLDNVTYGYGFIVDRFSNMLRYPGEKLFGLEFELNDLSPIGLSMQALVPDFMEFGDDGGILAGRIGFKPFKMTEKPIIGGLSISGMIATDLNQYAPARKWDYPLDGGKWDRDNDGKTDSTYLFDMYGQLDSYDDIVWQHRFEDDYDRSVQHKDQWAEDTSDIVTVVGGDIIVPIISTKVLNLDVYGQAGVTLDDENDNKVYKGWGIGAPGIGLNVGPFWARVEYRHIKDKFSPGYFGTYYLNERIRRNPVQIKEHTLVDNDLNGVFGQMGVNIKDFFIVDCRYQMLVGEKDTTNNRIKDQRFEGTANIGDVLLERIPKVNKVEAFYYQTDIDNNDEYKRIFYQSPTTYWGYRIGCEVIAGAYIIWETRYGWIWNKERTDLVDDKVVTIKAGLSF